MVGSAPLKPKVVWWSRLLLAIFAVVVSHEVLDQWFNAYQVYRKIEVWKVIWRFDLIYPHEPWVNLVFLFSTVTLAIIVITTLNFKDR